MTHYLVDTNVLLRLVDTASELHLAAVSSVSRLRAEGNAMSVCAQNLIEFWNVATRPSDRNGLGESCARAEADIRGILALFELLTDDERVFPMWLRTVRESGVRGVAVHDARLVAIMRVHGMSDILTFNVADFRRYSDVAPMSPAEEDDGRRTG